MDVVEFFSGIGGMRLALRDATKDLEAFPLGAFKAVDTSELVNQVYRHNFSNEEPWKVNIETIKVVYGCSFCCKQLVYYLYRTDGSVFFR